MQPAAQTSLVLTVGSHAPIGARVLVYGCNDCDWLFTVRDYKGKPGWADRLGRGNVLSHAAVTGHAMAWRSTGRVQELVNEQGALRADPHASPELGYSAAAG